MEASVWQLRQALVTSGPDWKFCCSSLNLLWSAVEAGGTAAAGVATKNAAKMKAKAALELLGKTKGMFIDRHEFGGPGAFAAMTDAELGQEIARLGAEIGISPKALAVMQSETKH